MMVATAFDKINVRPYGADHIYLDELDFPPESNLHRGPVVESNGGKWRMWLWLPPLDAREGLDASISAEALRQAEHEADEFARRARRIVPERDYGLPTVARVPQRTTDLLSQ